MKGAADLGVQHRQVGGAHVLFVPKSVLAAKGAGLVVMAKDEVDAISLFEVALSTAIRHGRLPDGTRWLSPTLSSTSDWSRSSGLSAKRSC